MTNGSSTARSLAMLFVALATATAITGCEQRRPDGSIAKRALALDTSGAICAESDLQAAIDALPVRAGPGASYSLPDNAKLRLCGPVTLNKRIILSGGSGQLLLDPGSTNAGLVLEAGAKWSSIRDLVIRSLDGVRVHKGIVVRAHGVRLENVLLRDLSIGIDATSTADLTAQRWSRLIIENNDVGVDLGANAYESLFEGFEIVGGNGVGIRELSNKGNTHVGHTIATGAVGLEVSGPINRSTFAGVYLDSGDSIASASAGRTLTVGGTLVSAIPTGERIGGRVSRLHFKVTDGTRSMSVDIPNASSHAAMVWRSKCEPNASSCTDEPGAWLLRRWPTEKRWGIGHSLTGAKPIRWDDSTSATPGAVILQLDPTECSNSGSCQ